VPAFGPLLITAALMLPAAPLPRVIVLGQDHLTARATFVEALRIQVTGLAAVDERPALASGSLGDRLDEAAAMVGKERAILAIWIDQAASKDRSGTDFVVYAVGKDRDRALIEIARLRADEGPDIDRALALKVGEFLDKVLADRPVEVDVARTFSEKTIAPSADRATPPRHVGGPPLLHFVADVGAVVAIGTASTGVQSGLAISAGARLEHGSWYAEILAGLRLMTDADVSNASGRLLMHEKMVSGGARLLGLHDRFAFGGFFEAGARMLEADGTSPVGGRGTASRTIPALAFGGESRVALSGTAGVRAAMGLEVDVQRQTFSIDGLPVSDLGRVRPTGSISVVFSIP